MSAAEWGKGQVPDWPRGGVLSVRSWCRTPEVLEGSRLPEAWATPALSPSLPTGPEREQLGRVRELSWLALS